MQTFDQITDPKTKIKYLNNFQNPKPTSKSTFQTNNPYNISTILGKTKKMNFKPVFINDLTQEINKQK